MEKINKDWLDDFVFMSQFPLRDMGYELKPVDTTFGFTLTNPNINEDIFIGSVDATEQFFAECDVETPKYIGYPESLISNPSIMRRGVSKVMVKDLSQYDYPYFVKPSTQVKLFTGDVIENDSQMKIFRDYYDVVDETELYKCDVVDFLSEYRCFVHRGVLKGLEHYRGDFKLFPSIPTIEYMISEFTDAPVAYSLDVGLTPDGETLLVEVNDMWALGSYGFDAEIYTKMVIDRFKEIANGS